MKITLLFLAITYCVGAQTPFGSNPSLPLRFLGEFYGGEQAFSFANDTLNSSRLESSFWYDQIYMERRGGRLSDDIHMWRQSNHVRHGFSVAGRPLVVGASLDKYVSVANSGSLDSEFRYRQDHLRFVLEAAGTVWPWLYLQAGAGARDSGYGALPIWTGGLVLKPLPEVNLRYGFLLEHEHRDFSIFIKDSRVGLRWIRDKQLQQGRAQLHFLNRRINLELFYHHCGINREQHRHAGRTTLPSGKAEGWKMSIRFVAADWIDNFGFRFIKQMEKTAGRLYQDAAVFGKITNYETAFEQTEVFVEKPFGPRHIVNLAHCSGDILLTSRGYADSWPFSPAWIDLLGVRSFAVAEYAYSFNQLKGHWRWQMTPGNRLDFSLAYENIRPSGELRTWQPQFLVFGIRDLRVRQLEVKEAKGFYAGIIWYNEISRFFAVSVGLQQYVPVIVSKTSGDGDSDTDNSGKSSVFSYGGGQAFLKIIFNF